MVVVEMHQQRCEVDALLAVFTGARLDAIQAIKEPVEIARRVLLTRLSGQPIHRLVRRTQRTRRRLAGVVLTEGLVRPLLRAITDEVRQLTLSVVLLHTRILHPRASPKADASRMR